MSEIMALAVFCVLVVVGSLGVAAWTAVSGAFFTLDGLLLVGICLLLATVFGGCFLWIAYDAHWLDRVMRIRSSGAAPGEKKEKA